MLLEHKKILSVNNEINVKAWVTPAIFETQLHEWNKKVWREGRQILLIVDN